MIISSELHYFYLTLQTAPFTRPPKPLSARHSTNTQSLWTPNHHTATQHNASRLGDSYSPKGTVSSGGPHPLFIAVRKRNVAIRHSRDKSTRLVWWCDRRWSSGVTAITRQSESVNTGRGTRLSRHRLPHVGRMAVGSKARKRRRRHPGQAVKQRTINYELL